VNVKKYACTICGRELAAEDLAYAKKREEDARFFYKDIHAPGVLPKMIKLSDSKDRIHYCQECLSNVDNWEKKNKSCSNCSSFLINFVRLPGIPDFYCHARSDLAVNNPRVNSCPDWQLGSGFRREGQLPKTSKLK